ncbi:MAG: LytTR family DNA-binding domain-containing protein [Acetatifactor muris]|nr:LytTR family DNA-binding domain-containing protein [Acetatifactor muris]
MRVAICDEERESCAGLKRLIRKQETDCEVICFHTCRQFLEDRRHFDILLLDIQMEKMGGIEVARALRIKQENTVLIFVTALKEYVPEAFDVSAFHYLLKPVSPEKFCKVFEDACRKVRQLESASGQQLFFRTRTRNFTISRNEILYVESRKRKVEIHTLKDDIAVYATMKHMEEQLGEGFYRCHRGYLVNMAYVTEYGTGFVRLQNGEKVYLAREKYSEFVKIYTEYLKEGGNVLVFSNN